MTEVLPTNELIRLGIFGLTEAVTRSPIAAAVSLGVSTFVVEESGGLAAAELFDTEKSHKIVESINKKIQKLHVPLNKNLSRASKIGWTLMGGTVIGMALEQRESNERTKENNRIYSTITSAWLAGASAVVGIMAAEGINNSISNPIDGGIVAGTLVLGGSLTKATANVYKKKKIKSTEPKNIGHEMIRDVDYEGRIFQYTTDKQLLSKAAILEQEIWDKEGYGNLDVYADYIKNARTITAFDGEKCIGLARLFESKTKLPPFITEMPYYSQKEKKSLLKLCKKGFVEELGTIAVDESYRNGLIFENLARLAYRDAYYGRGMKHWGVIMEPKRIQRMNKHYGFTFKQLGPEINYQGGLCAAHIMDLKEANDNVREKFPDIYEWFVNQPLNA
jgi:hypothetical protein